MKRWLRWILLAGVLAALLCVTAFAADAAVSGIYDVKCNDGYALVPEGTTQSVTIGEETVTLYAGAEKLTLTSAADISGYKLVMAQSSEGAPTEENLVYIDQSATPEGKVRFVIYPKQLTSGTYCIYISTSTGTGREKVAEFKYYQAYKLGDANVDGSISIQDAVAVLQHCVGSKPLTGTALKAADTNKDGVVTIPDAVLILQHCVGKITLV